MGVSVRKKDGHYYIFIRHNGQRVAQKCVDESHAIDTQKAIKTAMAAGQFNLSLVRPKPQDGGSTAVQTIKEFYEGSVRPLWDGSLSRNTYRSYDGSFRVHIIPAIGDIKLTELSRERVKRFVSC